MTSLPAANCSRSLMLQSETRGRRWFDGLSVVQPVPMSMMTEVMCPNTVLGHGLT